MPDKRPVNCGLCEGEMYYKSDIRHEPEVAIIVTDTNTGETVYWQKPFVHKRCWELLRELIEG
jgi:hypothetical protein